MGDDNPGFVNVGSAERPVMVPKHALKPSSNDGREYWDGIALGSIVLDDSTLDNLLKSINEAEKDTGS